MVQNGWTTGSVGGKWQEMPYWVGLNVESNGESVMGWTEKWHDQIFIF